MDEERNLLDGFRPPPCLPMQKICYGLGHVYNDLCAAVWFSYTLFYFQIILEMDSTTAGTLIMLGQVVDSLATPAAGWALDSIGTPRVWHLTGTVCVAIGFTLIFSIKNPADLTFLYYGMLVILFQIGWAIVQISHLSIITTIATSHNHSTNLTTIRYTASVCCNIFVYIITGLILQESKTEIDLGPNDYYKFKAIILIITTIGIISSLIYYCGINIQEEHEEDFSVLESTSDANNVNARSFLKYIVTYQVSLMYMSSRLYTILNLIYIPLYLNERKSSSDESIRGAVANVPLACFISSFITSIIIKNRSKCLNDQIIYGFGILTSLIACCWIGIGIPSGANLTLYFIAFLIGSGGSSTIIASLCITAQFIKTNGFRSGSVYSTVTFTDKLISGLVILLIQHFDCGSECTNFYQHVLTYATGFSVILSLVSLLTLTIFNPNLIY